MDKSDSEVKGIDRYVPTARAKALLSMFLLMPVTVFWVAPSTIARLIPAQNEGYQFLVTICCVLALELFIAFLLVLELMFVVYQSKHSRIHHYTYHAPEMNIKWLTANAKFKHYMFLVALFSFGIFVGVNL